MLNFERLGDRLPHSQRWFGVPGGDVACRVCRSENQKTFSGELALAFPGVKRIDLPPVYVCQKTWVCLDCGYIELVLPAIELERLRKGMGSRGQFQAEYSRLK